MLFHGRRWNRHDLVDRVGDLDQLGSVTAATLNDGPGAGLRTLTVRSPGGLSFTCLPDRGLDIGWADWRGTPLSWRSPVGEVAPAFAEHAGQGWLRTFGGGLLTTCGLTTAGQPSTDRGEDLGLHGRYSTIPARQVAWDVDWDGDDRTVTITGRIREASAIGDVLELHRTVRTTLGGDSVRIDDVVTNIGAAPAPHLFRYHVNLGFPLVDEHSHIDVPDVPPASSQPDASNVNHDRWASFSPPQPSAEEQIHLLQMPPAHPPSAVLSNPAGRPSLRLTWSGETLPLLLVWKLLAPRTYVTALEPSNCDDAGRAAARSAHTLPVLAPGEQRHHWLQLAVLPPGAQLVAPKPDAVSVTTAPHNGGVFLAPLPAPDSATPAAHDPTGAVHA